LKAPELDTQRSEAEARVRVAQLQRSEAAARVSSLRAQRIEAEARLASDEKTFERMKAASATPGVIAGNEVDIAARTVEAARARVRSWEESEKAAQAQVKAIEENVRALGNAASSAQSVENYLRITAPFDGVITERNVHPGSLAGPSAPMPMLRLQQVTPLRLVIAVPEGEVAGIRRGVILSFTVPAFPGEAFTGSVARVGQTLEQKTRTMPVELEVANGARRLAPGMFPEVIWPSRRARPSLFVPPGAIASTTERTFLVRVRDGVTEWIDVKRGAAMRHEGGDLIEVFGDIAPGDQVAARGTDELRAGTRVVAKPATTPRMNP
jgi:RND family efflux transporter MFP subunit